MPKLLICPRHETCPKKFNDICCCSVVHEGPCFEEDCANISKIVICREATQDEIMLSQF